MSDPNAMKLSMAICEALGLDPKTITSLELHVRPMEVTVDIDMIVEPEKGGQFVPVLRHFELKERDDG